MATSEAKSKGPGGDSRNQKRRVKRKCDKHEGSKDEDENEDGDEEEEQQQNSSSDIDLPDGPSTLEL